MKGIEGEYPTGGTPCAHLGLGGGEKVSSIPVSVSMYVCGHVGMYLHV